MGRSSDAHCVHASQPLQAAMQQGLAGVVGMQSIVMC